MNDSSSHFYNEQQKMDFIESLQSVSERKSVSSLFKATSNIEQENDTDLCFWTEDILTQFFSGMTFRKAYCDRMLASIRKYLRWCEQNIEGDVMTIRRGYSPSAKQKSRMFGSPQDLQDFMDALFEPEYRLRADNLYRAFLWILYSGITIDCAIITKNCDFSVNKMQVLFHGNLYHLYEQSIPAIQNCIEAEYFTRPITVRDGSVVEGRLQRVESDYLLRGVQKKGSDGMFSVETMRSKMTGKYKGNPALKERGGLSTDAVYLSGVFYRVWEQEQLGFPVRFDEITHSIQDPYTVRARLRTLTNDYISWKQEFHVT